jgi:hypothetical protein
MGTQIIEFEGNALPAHLRGGQDADTVALAALLSGGIKLLSIAGKVFTVVTGKEREVVMRKDDDETPAAYVDLVVLRANTHYTKTYYAKQYDQSDNAAKPDCFSIDGKTPDPSSESIQAKTCAACPHNVFGSKGKGKACQDNLRLAVAQADALNDPMMLRLPPTSFGPFGEACAAILQRGGAVHKALLRFKFDPESETPRLLVRPVGWLTPEMSATVDAIREEPPVLRMLTVSAEKTIALPAPKEEPAKPKLAAVPDDEDEPVKPKKVVKKAVDEDDEDEPVKPKKVAKKATDEDEAPAKAVISATSKSAASALLAKLAASADEDDD